MMANSMNSNSPEHPLHKLMLLLALMLLCGRVVAQSSFFECAKNPKACAPISSTGANTITPAASPAARPPPASEAGSQPANPTPAPEAANTQQQRRLEEDLQTREQQAREARQEAEQLRQALEEARSSRPAPVTIAYQPGRRRALVIGNNHYLQVPRLETAVQDARDMAGALASLGFLVTLKIDLAEKPMKQALREFKAQVQEGDEVLVFYAGHGVQIGGTNFLLPVDIRGEAEDQVRDDAVPLQRILDDLQDRRAGFALAVVDACRDNPFRANGRSVGGRGLAPTAAATGQMIIFSAGVGQQALDRLPGEVQASNGVFTRVFLREMVKPNIPVDRVLRTVRQEVVQLARAAGTEQTPALYDQAVGDFFFRVQRETAQGSTRP